MKKTKQTDRHCVYGLALDLHELLAERINQNQSSMTTTFAQRGSSYCGNGVNHEKVIDVVGGCCGNGGGFF